jgi:phenylpropionate dioxygenase-like ring-hydroxylating dioxygenase large terminal subunit
MGELMRQYWLPLLPVDKLDGPDGDPQRTRLLGEDLVLFRDSSGKIGLFAENCPHRGASLFFGRNEEGGIRCVYHGWKFDTAGNCVDMPSEPDESNFKDKVRARAYAAVEHGGVIWAYMGKGTPPGLPQFEWTLVPAEQRDMALDQRSCNWLQGLEGDIDTSHLFFLHGRLHPSDPASFGVWHDDKHPHLEVVPTDYGVVYGANREENDWTTYWRITQFLFPIFALFPQAPDGTVPGHIWVPMDDTHTMAWTIAWHPTKTMAELGRTYMQTPDGPGGALLPDNSSSLGRFRPRARAENDYEINRNLQRTKTYTGIGSVFLQDQAVTESMGAIQDRTIEHLGTSDGMIIQVRRRLLAAMNALADDGVPPPCVENPGVYKVRSCVATLAKGASWQTELHDWLYALTNEQPSLDLQYTTS